MQEVTRDQHGTIRERIRRHLRRELLPFWADHAWDEDAGGFIGHLGDHGRRTGVYDKYLLIQARLIWSFAAAHRHGLTGANYLDLARRGFAFLVERMWDPEHEGFFRALRRDGTLFLDEKWVYGHAFVIYALSEYSLAAGDSDALAWARRTYALLERRARRGDSGWINFFRRDWTPRWGEQQRRSSDVHLHLLEAFSRLYEAAPRREYEAAVRHVRELLTHRAMHPAGCILDRHNGNWRPRPWRDLQVTTSFGHNAELAWLLADASDVLGERPARHETAVRLVDYVLRFGWDPERGSIAGYGLPGRHVLRAWPLRRRRLLRGSWQQAEMMVGLLRVHEMTGDPKYLDAFARQFEWVWSRQIDHEGGEWHYRVTWPDGRPLPYPKGNQHKCCYHNARALMYSERMLDRLNQEALSALGESL